MIPSMIHPTYDTYLGCDKVLSPPSGTEPRYSSLVGVISRYFVLLSVQLSLILSGPEHLMGEQRTQAIRWRWLGRARWRARWHESVAIDDLRHLCNNYELRSIYAICAIITTAQPKPSNLAESLHQPQPYLILKSPPSKPNGAT